VALGGIGDQTAGYKGYGYATIVEILSAALQSGNFLKMLSGFDPEGNKQPYNLGHFFIAIDIASFIEPKHFKLTTGKILRQLRNSQKAPGAERIYTAGEREYLCWQERKKQGIPINKELQAEMTSLIRELGLNSYNFT